MRKTLLWTWFWVIATVGIADAALALKYFNEKDFVWSSFFSIAALYFGWRARSWYKELGKEQTK